MISPNIKNIQLGSNNVFKALYQNQVVWPRGAWWEEFGIRAAYIENVDNSSYIVTDVTPVPNKLSLNIDCIFLNDITSTPFGCRPTGNASSASNNIFQVNNTLRIDLLGDASLSIPKENNILYNITYDGQSNIFTLNGKEYTNAIQKSSIEVPYPFAIFANNSDGALSVGSACLMRYIKFNIDDKQYIPIRVIKEFTDSNNVTHNVGDWIMVDELRYKNVPTHIGTFTGVIHWWEEYGVLADYVISNGIDNWIDTSIATQPDLIIEMGVTYLKSGKEQSGFGAYDLNKVVIEAGSFTSSSDSFYAYDDDRTWDVTGFDVEMNKHYNLKYNFQNGLQIMYVDDVEVHRTTNTSGDLVGIIMVLFARNYGTSISNTRQNHMNAQWTYFKVSKSDGTVLADYKPFYISKKSMIDWNEREHQVGKYTMIDMVKESATPLHGADMEGLHTPWWEEFGVKAEYLKSDGTAYIDTGYTLQYDNGTTEIALSIENITTAPSAYGFIERSGDIGNRIAAGSTSSGLFVGTGNTIYLTAPTIENQKYNIVWNRKTSKTLLDGVEISTPPAKTSGNTYPAYLFSRNDKGKPDADGIYNLIGKIYYLREILDDVVKFNLIPIQVTKQFIDNNGVTHNVGDWIMVNELTNKDVPTHVGSFSGEITLDDNYYFKSISQQNPYYDLGRRIAYGKRIDMSVSFEDTTIDPYPLYGLFGSRQGYSQSTAYNTFIGRNDLPMATDVPVDMIPADRKFTVTLEDGKGYIDGVLTTTDTTPVTEWNYNSFLYNVNTEGLGGPMNTYRLPIGTRVYGCQIYDVATGVIENNYQPQPDQTLKCSITGEVLPKLGINYTDSWRVFKTDTNEEVLDGSYPVMDGLTHWWDSKNQSGTTWTPKMGNVNINTSDSWTDGCFNKLPNDTCETAQFNVNWSSGCTFDILYNQLKFTETGVNSNFDTQLFSVINQSNQEWLLNYTRQANDNTLSFYSPTLLGGQAYYSTLTPRLNEFASSVSVYNGSTNLKYYVNGNEELSMVTTVNKPGAIKFGMKRFIPVNNNLTALIKSIRIYNRALTEDEINNNRLYDLKVLEQSPYEELEWFETTPSKTGVKTNFIPTSTTAPLTKVELMCSFTSGSNGYLVNGIGGGPTLYTGMNPSSKLAYGNLASDSSVAYNLNYDTYYKLTIDYKNKTISVNDEIVASNITLYPYNKNNINFGLNCYVNTVSGIIFNNWGQKTQYCKIYVDDVLTHHWVGRLNNNKTDVYDKVKEVFLGDLGLIEGQENLIAGPSV